MSDTSGRIFLIDCPPELASAMEKRDLKFATGTFGQNAMAKRSDNFVEAENHSQLKHLGDYDIAIVNMQDPPLMTFRPQDPPPSTQSLRYLRLDLGLVNYRSIGMLDSKTEFAKILHSKGVIIVFLSSTIPTNYYSGHMDHGRLWRDTKYQTLATPTIIKALEFLPPRDGLNISESHGSQVRAVDQENMFYDILDKYSNSFEYHNIFSPIRSTDGSSQPPIRDILLSKHNQVVGRIVENIGGGLILLLPQTNSMTEFILELIDSNLAALRPDLFPENESTSWTRKRPYEHSEVLLLEQQKVEVTEEAKRRVELLDEKVRAARNSNQWMLDLLTGSGHPLVLSVVKALEELGFKNIKVVDEERDDANLSRREDLFLDYDGQTIVIDIKGLKKTPTDSDCMQANKHAQIKMREENRTNIISVGIINHQRFIKPELRDNTGIFRDEIVKNSKELQHGLISTWELFRMLKMKTTLQWKPAQILPRFLQPGRISIIPTNYVFAGKIVKVWHEKTTIGFVSSCSEIQTGQTLAIINESVWSENRIASMMIDNITTELAHEGQQVGIKLESLNEIVKEGQDVYLVKQP